MQIFFDLDGTLVDVSKRHHTVYHEITEKFGGKPLEKAEYWDLKRKKVKWAELLPLSGLSANVEQEYLAQFIKKIEDPAYLKMDTLFPGALVVLETLAVANDCYLVSLRRNRDNLLAELEWLKLTTLFKKILTGHSENDGYDVKEALMKDILGDVPGVVIGDTEADIVAGKELGLKTIAVTSGIRDEQILKALHPHYMISAIDEAVSLI